VYGNDFLRQLLRENDFSAPSFPDDEELARQEVPDDVAPEVRARYIRLCRQLDLLEIEVPFPLLLLFCLLFFPFS
jgi:hypothetical protein